LRIIQTGPIVELPWNKEVLDTLQPHFSKDTKFYVQDEAKGRIYSGPREMWEKLPAVDFTKAAMFGEWRE
jgi:hypothetical protein